MFVSVWRSDTLGGVHQQAESAPSLGPHTPPPTLWWAAEREREREAGRRHDRSLFFFCLSLSLFCFSLWDDETPPTLFVSASYWICGARPEYSVLSAFRRINLSREETYQTVNKKAEKLKKNLSRLLCCCTSRSRRRPLFIPQRGASPRQLWVPVKQLLLFLLLFKQRVCWWNPFFQRPRPGGRCDWLSFLSSARLQECVARFEPTAVFVLSVRVASVHCH